MSEKNREQVSSTGMSPLLNEREAAAFLNVSRMTLIRWRQAGKIHFYRLGWRICYSKQQLLDFLASREV